MKKTNKIGLPRINCLRKMDGPDMAHQVSGGHIGIEDIDGYFITKEQAEKILDYLIDKTNGIYRDRSDSKELVNILLGKE